MVEMIDVDTELIKAIGYEEAGKRLHINFISTEKYIYQGVPKIIHARLMRAHSKDIYLDEEIKNKYRHTEIY